MAGRRYWPSQGSKVTQLNVFFFFFIPRQIITIFSPPNCSDRPMFRKYPKNFNNPGSGEKCPYLRSVACQIYSVLFYLKLLK